MRILATLLLLATALAPVSAQTPTGPPGTILDAMRREFPLDHAALDRELAGKTPEEARRLAYAGIERFLRAHHYEIAGAPAPMVVALEARQGAMLRALEKQDVRLCAAIGDRGVFSPEALAGPAPPGLDEFGVGLIEAAKAGAGVSPTPPNPQAREDFAAWLAMVGKIEPDIPVRAMLGDRALRSAAPPVQLCRGAAAMHEAAVALPGSQAERMSRILLGLSIGPPAD